MKILIPTNDGLTIAPDFDKASSFRLLTIINGIIKEDELRSVSNDVTYDFLFNGKDINEKVRHSGNMSNTIAVKNKNSECLKIAVTTSISNDAEKKLKKNNYEVFLTRETNITNAIIFYLKNYATIESDYCCSP